MSCRDDYHALMKFPHTELEVGLELKEKVYWFFLLVEYTSSVFPFVVCWLVVWVWKQRLMKAEGEVRDKQALLKKEQEYNVQLLLNALPADVVQELQKVCLRFFGR